MLITGAGSGVGLACAREFHERGAQVILSDCDPAALARVEAEFGAHCRFCDVASDASVTIFTADLLQQFPRIDLLINGAGSGYVRTLGMMRISRALLPSMKRHGSPAMIVNIAPGACGSRPSLFPHAASPSNFRRLSATVALQARGSAVRVATVLPRARLSIADREAGASETRGAIRLAAEIVGLVFGEADPLASKRSAIIQCSGPKC